MVQDKRITIPLSKSRHIINLRSGYACGQLVRHEKDGKFYYANIEKLEIIGNCKNDADEEIYQKDIKLGIHSCWKHEEENENVLVNLFVKKQRY